MTRHPIEWSVLVDYWANDLVLEEQDALEEHLLGCAECSRLSERVAAVTESIRGLIPPLISQQTLTQLRARGLRVVENPMLPGERRAVVFPREADILLHRLGGLRLKDAARVRFTMRVESSGEVLNETQDVPFERERGEVLIACQKHFATMPADTVAEVRVVDPAGVEHLVMYTILHQFEATNAR